MLLQTIIKALLISSLIGLLSSSAVLQAQQAHLEEKENQFRITTDEGVYEIQFYTQEILEVSYFPEGKTAGDYQESHAVVLNPSSVEVEVNESSDFITLSSDGIRVIYDLSREQFSYYYEDERLLRDHNGFTHYPGEDEDGDRDQEAMDHVGFRIDFQISEHEALMGGGSRALGMNRRGHRLELYNRAHYGYEYRSELVNFTLPIIMSSNRYMVHFDNPTTGWLDLDSENDHTIAFEGYSGRKTFQIIVGDTWERIIENYTSLTGLQPIPPRWALGNFSSRFGYRNQEEVLETASRFRELDVPMDAIIIDLYWFGPDIQGHMGNLAWDNDNWPDPAAMVQELEEMGVKTVLITEPFILTTSDRWDEAVEANAIAADSEGYPATWDFYFGNTGLINLFGEGYDWFWDIYRDLKQTYGIHGWWGDLGEPEVHPDWVQHPIGSAREVHNIYGHQWARMLHEGYRRDFSDQRYFNLMRAGYAGSQRFGMIPWTGDVSRNWGGLTPQPEIALQMGMQGMAYIHSDLGGFAWPVEDAELYTRWMQYGVFQPVYRPHAQDDVPSEPVFWDEETVNHTRTAIELRYRLMPYIYTEAFNNSQTGIPFMRPLFFEEPDNFKFYHISESYLFGSDLLVAPVLRQGAQEVSVHMPETANWFDFYTGKKYRGGKEHTVPTEEDRIPVFVRGGAVIPKADLVQSLDDYSVEHITLRYFHDSEAETYSTTIYHDDGETPDAYSSDAYEKLFVERTGGREEAHFTFTRKTGGRFTPSFSEITLEVNHAESEPAAVLLDGVEIDFEYDSDSQILQTETFTLGDDTTELRIRF